MSGEDALAQGCDRSYGGTPARRRGGLDQALDILRPHLAWDHRYRA
ncbi:hypothetical protein ACFWD7_56330 [Streptomyces mirabilis]